MTHAARIEQSAADDAPPVPLIGTAPSSGAVRGPAFSPLGSPALVEPLVPHSAAKWSILALVTADLAALFLAREAVLSIRSWLLGPMSMSPAFFAASVLWISLRVFFGMYPGYGITQPEELRRSTVTTLLAALSHFALLFGIQEASGSRFIAVGVWALLVPFSWIARDLVKRLLVRARAYGNPAIVLGAGTTGSFVIREILDNPTLGIIPVAAFDDDPAKLGLSVHGVPILGTLDEAATWHASFPVSDAIIALPSAGARKVVSLAQRLGTRYNNVGVVADLVGVGNLWSRTKSIGVCSVVEMRHERVSAFNLTLKRAFDLIVGIPLFLLSLPIVALCVIAVKISSPGAPAFFSQSRVGQNGRRIRVWKIRTMVPDAEKKLEQYLRRNSGAFRQWNTSMKLENDPRVIALGKFLRRASLDELPQLWNVVRGDMSLVGPRPFPDYHLVKFSDEFRELRTQVPPGITGYWQITHRSASNLAQQEASDAYYVHNWSLWLDLWIMFRTVGVVVSGKGAY